MNTSCHVIKFHSGENHIEFTSFPALYAPEFPFRMILSLHKAGHMTLAREKDLSDRQNLFNSLAIGNRRIFSLTQVHSRDVVFTDVCGDDHGNNKGADGLITAEANAVLSVTVADCLPIFMWSSDYSVFALLHSGWKGTGIVIAALRKIRQKFGIEASDIHCFIGPGIGDCCYAVPKERYDLFRKEYGDTAVSMHDSHFCLNLREANRLLLETAGIASLQIVNNCTCCSPQLGSYRRDGKEGFHNMMALFGRF
ncbi:MAG: polyphenol oxidase family protein [Spirochaetales bacterium]|nr:polyphenol oxidase family protein [Spirochaetales bacterium]